MKRPRPPPPEPAADQRRVLLVDDHPIVCEGLAQRINSEPDLTVCGQARDVHAGLAAIEQLRPDIAVVDLALGTGSGIELLKDIKVRHPDLPVLVLSMHDEALYAERSLHAGAKGYVMKQEQPEVLLRAIRQVLRGQVYLSDKVKDTIVNRLGGVAPEGEGAALVQQLSDRELQVFELMGDGYGTQEIAARLHLSVKTVASHRENIKAKLDLHDSDALTRVAVHWQRYSARAAAAPAEPPAGSKPRKPARPAR